MSRADALGDLAAARSTRSRSHSLVIILWLAFIAAAGLAYLFSR